MDLSVFFFGDAGQAEASDHYSLVLDVARTADRVGLDALWLPERHFHAFGGPFPNPAVLGAAVSAVTERLRIRAGSVVLPLHHPARVAEEWAAVDVLSNGRVDVAFAPGWNPNDFVLAADAFDNRRAGTISAIDTVQRLWAGETVTMPNGKGEATEIRTFPRPIQPKLPTWLTCTSSRESFITAGRVGMNVLTALLHQSLAELTVNLDAYRTARREAGWAGDGHVSLMLHTHVGTSTESVRRLVRNPFARYLESSADLWGVALPNLARLTPAKKALVMDLAVDRYVRTSGLFGSVDDCASRLDEVAALGVSEVACLIDFGLEAHLVLDGVAALGELRRQHRVNASLPPPPGPQVGTS